MGKEQEKPQKERNMFVGVVWNCAGELKLLLTALLFLFSLITVFQFLPSRLSFSVSDLRSCASSVQHDIVSSAPIVAATTTVTPPPSPPPPPPPPPTLLKDKVVAFDGGVNVIKRAFNTYGAAAYNFIQMSAYRGGMNTFAVNALASKPLHVFGKPSYLCEWVPLNPSNNSRITTDGYKMLPDWGYGHVYTVVIVNCTFPVPVGADGSGGQLLIHATTNGGGDRDVNTTDTIYVLTETPGAALNATLAQIRSPTTKYDYLYCGSSLYGNLSPQRVREWMAYHVRFLGTKSHFVIHDAGGVHEEVMEVLRPWIEKEYVTLHDIRDQERFDGYYHNQFLVVNDCLHRYRFDAKWIFFFDVDEYIFVPKKSSIRSVMDSLSGFTQFTIEQMPMSNKLCLLEDYGKQHRRWGFEKLVYKDSKRGIRRDRKYAIQPRNVFATGVHMSQNTIGKTTHNTEGRIMYYHYHGTISERREPCRKYINVTNMDLDGIPYVLDTRMRDAAGFVKRFEQKMIGTVLQKTRQ